MQTSFWSGKRVFITGHTGFKGGWLCILLKMMGAQIYGFALKPDGVPNFYHATNLLKYLDVSTIGDIRDSGILAETIKSTKPQIVFHLAAQPLVLESYENPKRTYETNVLGTLNLFEACRASDAVNGIINITTDKCYENQDWHWPYRESDTLGGYDPYSNSKACAELLTKAYRNSFFNNEDISVATARAGNVIGGGDWSSNRLVPDFIRAWKNQTELLIRHPSATRPWQHVLDPLAGYLQLGQALFEKQSFASSEWNFGPEPASSQPVGWVVNQLTRLAPNTKVKIDTEKNRHESQSLTLDSSKAKKSLNWKPRWSIQKSIHATFDWYQNFYNDAKMDKYTEAQIEDYLDSAKDG